MRSEQEIRDKIEDSIQALKDFAEKKESSPEEFFTIARQATFLTALFWVIEEPVPMGVTKLAVPIVKKMSETQAKSAADKKAAAEKEAKKAAKGKK